MRRFYLAVWRPRKKRPLLIDRRPGFERWRIDRETRRKAYISQYLRQWHIRNAACTRNWYAHDPAMQVAANQSRRAQAASVAVDNFSAEEWVWLAAAYEHRCAYCGREVERLTPDHVIPLSQGGSNTLSNIVPACESCNKRKGGRTPEESGMRFACHIEITRYLEQLRLI
jgi:5-methylcytosine-specific restriction endonuclease McrA